MRAHANRGVNRTLGAAALLAGLVACGKDPASGDPGKPGDPASSSGPEHVLMLVVDTLRADHLSAWGHERPTSPNIDSLAESGVRFARAVSQCSWTAPSMVSLMTGRYLADDRLDIPAEVATLAELFQQAGFATAAFISNPLLTRNAGFHRGFDEAQHIPPYAPDDPIVAWLEEQAGERTFTYVHLNEPHDPYEAPEGEQVWMPEPPPLDPGRVAVYRELAPDLVTEDELSHIRKSIAGYDDDILYTDHRIGLMLDALRRTGQLARTAIVVTADHGEGLWTRLDFANNGPRAKRVVDGLPPSLSTHFKMTHGNQVHTELVHIPLILVAPGLEGGQVVESWVENVDVVPTLLELCNIRDPGGLQGESLLRTLEEPDDWERQHKPFVYTATRFVCSVITQDGWQLMVPTPLGECQEGLAEELFNLIEDPEARHNVAAKHPERVAELRALLFERRESGMPGHFELDPQTTIHLEQTGYAGNIVDELEIAYAERPSDELLGILENSRRTCVERMYAARAVAGRKSRGELDARELARVEALLEKELAVGVLRAFGR